MRNFLLSFAFMLVALFAGVQVVGAQTVYKVNENFDGITSGIPTGWDNADGTTTTDSYKWNSYSPGYSGRCVRFNSYANGNGNTNMLKTPSMDLSTGQWILKFKYKNPTGGDFSVFISTDGGATYATALFTGLTAQANWTSMETSITTAAAQSQQVKIVFQGTSNWGNGDAYIYLDDVTVESAPTCQSPTGLYANNLTMTGATLNWGLTVDGDVPGSYIYTLTDAGGNVIEQNAALSAPGLIYTIATPLSANTTYTATLQSDCSGTYSGQGNTTSVTFTTLCASQSAPYTEDFDALTALPGCTYSQGATIASSGKTGKGLALQATASAGAYFIFPELNLSSNDVEIGFNIKTATASAAVPAAYYVGLVTDPSDFENTQEIIYAGSLTNANWKDIRVNTTVSAEAVRNTARLFVAVPQGSPTFYLDDINIHQMPTCSRPENLTITNVDAYEVTLDWEMTNATNVRVYAMNTADSSVVTALATQSPFTMTGLSEQTNYQFTVRGICSPTDSSDISAAVTAKTKCGIAASTVFFEGAETTSGTALPNCWETGYIANPGSRTSAPFATGTTYKQGTRGFSLNDMTSGTVSYLCSQKLNFDVANKYSFRYQIYRPSGTSYNGEGLKIFVTPTPGDTTNAVALIPFVNRYAGNSPVGTSGWNTYEAVINYQGEGYIMVVGYSKFGSSTWFDNLEVFLTPTCPKVTGLSAGNTTKTTADIYWTAGLNETQWLISYELKQGATTLATVNDTLVNQPSVTLSGLNSATTYTVSASVRAYCGVGDTAEVVTMNATNVTTQCDAISQLPYTMGFEDGETFVKSGSTRHPLCWTHYNNATSTSDTYKYAPYAYNSNARTGSRCLYYYNYQSSTSYGDTATFALPEIDSTAYAINTLRVKFWTKNSSTSYSQILYVGVMTDPNDPTTFVKVDSFVVNGNTYVENVASFANYTGTGTHIAFAWYKNAITSSSSTVYLDDVTVDPIPTCADLVGTISVTGVSDTSVTFTIADQTATAWQYAYGLTGTPVAQMTPVSHTGASCTITGLTEATTYDIYVRRDCGNETGAWSVVTTFSTTAVPAQMPYVCGFEDAQENYRWQYADGAGVNVFTIGTDENGVYAGTNAMYVTSNRTTGTYTYNTSSATQSYAYRTMHFDAKGYQFEFKFKCTGGESSYDFGRILLTNATVSIPSGQTGSNYTSCTFPASVVEFDDEFLNGSNKMLNTATYQQGNPDANGWVTISRFIDMTNRPGDYNLVLLWNDDTSYGTANYPLAIDNINVYQLTCIPPTNVLTDSITSTSACLNIVQGGDPVAQWEVVVSDQPFTKESVPDSATYRQVVNSNHVSISGLTQNTVYYYIVRAVCGANDSSAWNEVATFHTFCATQELPYNEGFEGPTSTDCWNNINVTGSITRNSSVRHSGNAAMKITGATAVSPEFNVVTFAPDMLNGWCRATTDSATFQVGVMNDPNDVASFEILTSVMIPNANEWVEFTSYFNLLTDPDLAEFYNARYIVINTGDNTIYFDDLIVDVIPTCPKPTEVSITNVTAHSFDISFTDNTLGQAQSWVVYTNGTPNVITNTTATITGLAAHATYNVSVAAICSATDTSLVTMCGEINTQCDALPVPYSCGFEVADGFNYSSNWVDGVLEGECWNTIGMLQGGSSYPYYKITNTVYVHNGAQGLQGYSKANTYAYLILPAFQEPTNTLTMEFWYRSESTFAGSPYVEVGYMTDPADSTSFVLLQQTPKTTTFTKVEQSFVNSAIPANARIAFRFGGSTSQNYYMGLDDIMVKAIRNCSDPYQPTVSDISYSSAKVSFTDTCATHNAWEYVFGVKGIDPATATPVSLTADTFSLSGLTPVTNYDVYVRAICGVGDYSNWMKASFTTSSVPASLPYVCDFSDAAEANMWESAGTEANAFVSGQDADAAFTTGGSALFVSSDGSSYGYNTGSTASSAAFRIFDFEASSYSIEFDWKCSGGEAGYDVGRAYLIPASATAITLTSASTLPTGAIDLTDGTIMQGATGVQHVSKVIDFTGMAGYYKLVFAWRNDYSYGDQFPLSVSNIAISELSCQLIANTNVSSVTSSSATVTFSNPNTGAPTKWVLSTSTSVADSVRTGVTTSDTIYLTNLAAASSYNLLLSAVCSETSASPYLAVPFTTSCGIISTFPYAQNFDGYAANTIPLCWDNSASTTSTVTSTPANVWGVFDCGGNKALRMYNYWVQSGTAILESPQFDLPAQPVEMTFDYSHNASCDAFSVEISTNNGASYTSLGSYGNNGQGSTTTTGTMTNVTIDLTNYANESVKFRLFVNANYGSGSIFFDNMVINYIPACRGPKTAPTITGFTMTTMSAQANMAGKDSIEFGIAPYASGVTPAAITATQVSADGNACFTGLTGSSQYAIWYRYICDSVTVSDWSLAFATATTMGTDCFDPQMLRTVGVTNDHHAAFTWSGAPDATLYEYELYQGTSAAGTRIDSATVATVDTIAYDSLAAMTNYYFRVRGFCATDTTNWVGMTIKTTRQPASLPFICGFENAGDAALWEMGSNNIDSYFMIGNGTNHGGSNSLYVTTDGSTCSYTSSGNEAYARVLLPMTAGNYLVSYDYYCYGESTWDLARLFLYPSANATSATSLIEYSDIPSTNITGALTVSPASISSMAGWATAQYIVTVPADAMYYFQVNWADDTYQTNYDPIAIDNISISELTCMPLSSVTNIGLTDHSASYIATRYTAGVDIQYGYSTVDNVDSITWTTIQGTGLNDTIRMSGLSANTTYYLFARAACDSVNVSAATRVVVTTTPPAQNIPFICGFESSEATTTAWTFANDATNAFVIGGAAQSTGSQAIFISDDASTWNYSVSATSYSYAYVPLAFGPGTYDIEYDWNCIGEGNYDYGRIFLAPATFIPTGGQYVQGIGTTGTPTGWISLDGNAKLNQVAGWNSRSLEQVIADSTNMNLILYWYNDGSAGTQPPIAFDNIRITLQTCPSIQISTLGVDTVATDMFTMHYVNPNAGASTMWILSSNNQYTDTVAMGVQPATDSTFTATGLAAGTQYFCRLYSVCDSADMSKALKFTVRTQCAVMTQYPYHEGFEDFATNTYNLLTGACWSTTTMTSSLYGVVRDATSVADAVHSGSQGLQVYNSSSSSVQVYALPEMDSLNGKTVSFWHRAYDVSSYYVTLSFGYINAAGTFVSLDEFSNKQTAWMEYNNTLQNIPAGVTRLAFQFSGYLYYYLDDIHINTIATADTIFETVCNNQDYSGHGITIPSAQMVVGNNIVTKTVQATTPGVSDTTFIFCIYKRPAISSDTYDTICAGQPYNKGMWQIANPQSRLYFQNYPGGAVCGCDSADNLYLTVIPTTQTISDTICQGDAYQFGSQTLTQTGTYVDTIPSPYGCNIVTTLNLFVQDSATLTTASICSGESYSFHGNTYTQSGTYRVTTQGAAGCSINNTLVLTVFKSDSTIYVSFCKGGSVVAADTVISTPGLHTKTTFVPTSITDPSIGCYVTFHINATENPILEGIVNDIACQGYPYTGYGISGIVVTNDTTIDVTTKSLVDASCDSVGHVHLTYVATYYAPAEEVSINAGESYTWHYQSYTESGIYRDTLYSVLTGCDSICTLKLTVGGVEPVGVENVANVNMTVVPNPVNAGATALVYGEFGEVAKVEIISNFGQIVETFKPETYPIEVNGISAAGIYYVRVTTKAGSVHLEKLIVK